MVNFGPLAAEIGSGVWGTPSKFQRLSRLGSVAARHAGSGRQPNFAGAAPPIFGRAAITLGIGPHSSYLLLFQWRASMKEAAPLSLVVWL